MEYKVMYHVDNHELSRVVNTYLRKGWHLYGPLNVVATEGASAFTQAMIKQVQESDKPDLKAV